MASVHETVRIGIAVRRPEVRFSLRQSCDVIAMDGDVETTLPPGEYSLRVVEEGAGSTWGAKVHTFSTHGAAQNLVDKLTSHGVHAQVIPMGRPAIWGAAGELYSVTHAVVVGEEEDPDTALLKAGDALEAVPADPEGIMAGLRRYDDEIWAVAPIRLLPPEGGTLSLESGVDGWERRELPSPIRLRPEQQGEAFQFEDVRIGADFHWDHTETLGFRGRLDLVADQGRITAVNVLGLDDYLAGVLGSEMRADWPAEALAAQALAARSSVLATRGRHHYGEAFDLCNDDHCQCYYGISRESDLARTALRHVEGQLLVFRGRVADTRYAKTCGGITDTYALAWDDEELPYLRSVLCGPVLGKGEGAIPAFDAGDGARTLHHLVSSPPRWAACNPSAHPYPDSVKDMESLYRWSRTLGADEIARLVEHRIGRSLGRILDLIPLQRGPSGRIRYLRVEGEEGTVTVGRELKVRRLLSESHLPSSAFEVQRAEDGSFRLVGIGWGHGVGMCQLGAATLARKGWSALRIIRHYYPGVEIAHG